jgi:hypothetical protein
MHQIPLKTSAGLASLLQVLVLVSPHLQVTLHYTESKACLAALKKLNLEAVPPPGYAGPAFCEAATGSSLGKQAGEATGAVGAAGARVVEGEPEVSEDGVRLPSMTDAQLQWLVAEVSLTSACLNHNILSLSNG